MKSSLKSTLAVAAALAAISSASIAGDIVAGKAKAEMMCQTCHGMDGQATLPMTANITAQQKDYMITQLHDYKSGKREHHQMSIIVQTLSEEDIENVSEWYSSVEMEIKLPK